MFHDPNHDGSTGFEYDCPSCGVPMEVIDRFILNGVPTPVEHVKVRCPIGHWYTIPTEWLAGVGTGAEASVTSSAGVVSSR